MITEGKTSSHPQQNKMASSSARSLHSWIRGGLAIARIPLFLMSSQQDAKSVSPNASDGLKVSRDARRVLSADRPNTSSHRLATQAGDVGVIHNQMAHAVVIILTPSRSKNRERQTMVFACASYACDEPAARSIKSKPVR